MNQQAQWRSAMPSLNRTDGYAVACCNGLFAQRQPSQVILFGRHELKAALDGCLFTEHGVGYWDEQPVYMLELAQQPVQDNTLIWISPRQLMLQGQVTLFKLLAFASQVASWSREHRFCGSCGQPMQNSTEHRMRFCIECRHEYYPRIAPCMIVLVTRGDKILLARAPRFVSGMYSTLAGYAEPGETIEQCVHREVAEEVCIKVHNLKYITSQNWPFPHSMMLGFHAEYHSGEIQRQIDEIEDAQWFSIYQLPDLPMPGSIARYLIDLYLRQYMDDIEPVLPY